MPYKDKEYAKLKAHERYINNKDEHARKGKEWREKNKDKLREYYKKRYSETKDQVAVRHKEYYKNNKDKKKEYDFHHYYGITIHEYDELLMKQNGVCAICGKPETHIQYGKFRPLSVDHDHATGKVRGLLCTGCNRGIGFLRDDPKLLNKAAEYLVNS